jgi:MinD-like ATPase involved in chromosome partitioning or flagellar assembly
MFGVSPSEDGYADVIKRGKSILPSVIWKTEDIPLFFLPLGTSSIYNTYACSSQKVGFLLQNISSLAKFGSIIIDTPPILANTAAISIAQHADKVIFVIGSQSTTEEIANTALDILDADHKTNLILNRTHGTGNPEQFGSCYETYHAARTQNTMIFVQAAEITKRSK